MILDVFAVAKQQLQGLWAEEAAQERLSDSGKPLQRLSSPVS